ncbi:Translocation protein sec72 [Madurella fahalii]|uniref:Translocation protein sec72 n=1 Tax=Madurella fahalii TaxID=1157608 RepID=A0ABQ0GAJ9_9PEZI
MSDLETFTFIPLQIDPKSKAISAVPPASKALETELAALNALHRSLHSLEGPMTVPPPPVPVNPKRSANVNKLRESGNAEYRKQRHAEAIKFYTLGLQMALTRPPWEPSQLVREEVHQLYSNRAQAHMQLGNWPEAAVDAEASVEAKRQGNAKAWFRRGKCLLEMGRLAEAKEWVGRGLEFEGEEKELIELLREIEGKMAEEKAARDA